MRRKQGYFLIALAVGMVLVLVVVYRYYTGLSAPTTIPANATKVLQVNLRQLEKDIIFDVLGHPLKYIGERKKRADSIQRKIKSLTKGLSIPKALYFYTSDEYPGWYSLAIQLSNRKKFTEFLEESGFHKVMTTDVLVYSQQQFHFYLYEDAFVIGYSKKPLQENCRLLFESKAVLTSQDAIVKVLIHSSSDLTIVSDQGDFITGDFEKGAFKISGKLSDYFDALLLVDRSASADDLFDLSFQLNPRCLEEVRSEDRSFIDDFEKFTHLSVDSILPNLDGRFSFRLSAVGTVFDTIVTYTYDDDFNKVETRSIQRATVPYLGVKMGLKKEVRLIEYFMRKGAIQEIDGKCVFTPIPLYTINATQTENEVVLSIGALNPIQWTQPTKFYWKFRVKDYLEHPLDIPMSSQCKRILTLISELELEVTQENEVRGNIELRNAYRNFLAQLIRP
ncbi:hypothetical protein MWU59_12770 [Flavobacteriaceae bacterium F08102]|nr:hypothetical protein [Flavobacteriaceae bacterium F08102]